MRQPSEQIARFLIFFIFVVFVIKNFTGSGVFESPIYKGRGYSVVTPDGWIRVKEDKKSKQVYPKGVEVVMFVPKGANPAREKPGAVITLFTKKLTTPIWIEDEFPDIIAAIKLEGHKVMDKGEIKLDDQIFYWFVYHDERTPELVLEFYYVSDNNTFYKLQYSAHPDVFNVHRRGFEALKDSFKFRYSLY